MRNPTYLERSRHNVFYFRWPILNASGRRVGSVKISLRTSNSREALYLSQKLSYVGSNLIAEWVTRNMRYEEIRTALQNHFRAALDKRKQEINDDGRLKPLDVAALENGIAFGREAVATGSDISINETDDELIARYADRYQLSLKTGTPAHDTFKVELRKAYTAYCEAVLTHDASFDRYDFTTPDLGLSRSSERRTPLPTGGLREIAKKFLAEEGRADRWVKRSEDQKVHHIEILEEIWGTDREIGTISSLDAQHVKTLLMNYPRNRNKREETRKLTMAEIAQLSGHATLTVRTINTYLQTYSALFGWAKRNKYVQENFFDGMKVRENKKQGAEAQRDAFTPAQISQISDALINNNRNLITRHYQKWGPLIGLYTGARLNEICQIQVADVKLVDGIWCFDLNDDGDDKSLKNVSSRRTVPVHDKLIELGLLQYVELVKAKGHVRLFQELSFSLKEGYGRALGRWFNDRFLVELKLKAKGRVFHSFRHTMVTTLIQAGVHDNIVKALVGHKRTGVTQEFYFKQSYTVAQLKEAILKF